MTPKNVEKFKHFKDDGTIYSGRVMSLEIQEADANAAILFLMGMTILVIDSLTKKPGEYTLENGIIVVCNHSFTSDCGIDIYDCESGLEYKCQKNVIKREIKP